MDTTPNNPWRIDQLGNHPAHTDTIAQWVINEWGDSNIQELKQTFTQSPQRPGALIALTGNIPIAMLSYKMYPLPEQTSEVLWFNALYVMPPYRVNGIGKSLVQTGITAAQHLGVNTLYVYTNLPMFYEKLGWQHHSHQAESDMHILKTSSS